MVLDQFKNYEDIKPGQGNSEKIYKEQIERQGYELYPNTKLISYIKKELKKQGIILPKVPLGVEEEAYKKRIEQAKKFEDYSIGGEFNRAHRMSSEVIATTALWMEQHRESKTILGDIPISLFKYNLINSYPLLELEKLLEQVTYRSF